MISTSQGPTILTKALSCVQAQFVRKVAYVLVLSIACNTRDVCVFAGGPVL